MSPNCERGFAIIRQDQPLVLEKKKLLYSNLSLYIEGNLVANDLNTSVYC